MKNHGYRTGSKSTTAGLAGYDEDGLGSEFVITNKGVLTEFDAGDRVFNSRMKDNIWDIADDPKNYVLSLLGSASTTNNNTAAVPISIGDIHMHGVQDVNSFNKAFINAISDGTVQKALQEGVLGSSFGHVKTTINRYK